MIKELRKLIEDAGAGAGQIVEDNPADDGLCLEASQSAPAAALAAFVTALPWGQHGAAFVTLRAAYVGADERWTTIWVNRRRLVTVGPSGQIEIPTARASEEEAREAKEANVANEVRLRAGKVALEAAIHHHDVVVFVDDWFGLAPRQAEFGGWVWHSGQAGGSFWHPDHGAIPGYPALRLADNRRAAAALEAAAAITSPRELEWDSALYGARW